MMENNENGVVQEVSTEVVVSDNTIVNSPTIDNKVSKKNRNFNTLVVVLFILLALGLSYGSYRAGINKANEINEKEAIKNNTENKLAEDDKIVDENDEDSEESKDNVNKEENENINSSESDKDISHDSGNQPTIGSDGKPTKNSSFTFVKENIEVIEYSGKKHEILTYYYLDPIKIPSLDENSPDSDGSAIRTEIFVDNKRIFDIKIFSVHYADENANEVLKAAVAYETKIMDDISNSDSYLLLYANHGTEYTIHGPDEYVICYIVNKDGLVLHSLYSEYSSSSLHGILVTKDMLYAHDYIPYDDKRWDGTDITGEYVIYDNDNGSFMEAHEDFIYYVISGDESYTYDEYLLDISNGEVNDVFLQSFEGDRCWIAGQS